MKALALAVAMLAWSPAAPAAQSAPAPGAAPADKPATDTPPGELPLIETSHVIAPRTVGDFVLEQGKYDPQYKALGVALRYRLKDEQALRMDVYVYPAGRAEPRQALARGMQDFRQSLRDAETHGMFEDMRTLDDAAFALAPPPAQPRGGQGTQPDALAALAGRASVPGQRLRMAFAMPPLQTRMHSNGYLFYRQLYYFKVRASAAAERIERARFDALADRGARQLVQAIEVWNQGGCGNIEVLVDADEKDAQRQQDAMLRQLMAAAAENCTRKADPEELARKSRDAHVETIRFGADEWASP